MIAETNVGVKARRGETRLMANHEFAVFSTCGIARGAVGIEGHVMVGSRPFEEPAFRELYCEHLDTSNRIDRRPFNSS